MKKLLSVLAAASLLIGCGNRFEAKTARGEKTFSDEGAVATQVPDTTGEQNPTPVQDSNSNSLEVEPAQSAPGQTQVDSAGAGQTVLAESPRVQVVKEDAKTAQLDIEIDQIKSTHVETLLGADIVSDLKSPANFKLEAIIKLDGLVAKFMGSLIIDKASDGKAIEVRDFKMSEVIKDSDGETARPVRAIRATAHCSNECTDLFIHVQIDKADQKDANKYNFEAGAFYNFRYDGSSYKIVNSSVDPKYKTTEQVLLELKN